MAALGGCPDSYRTCIPEQGGIIPLCHLPRIAFTLPGHRAELRIIKNFVSGSTTPTRVSAARKFVEAETTGVSAELPLSLPLHVTVVSSGRPYEGDDPELFWSPPWNGVSLPLPVGYTAVRDFKGVQFTQIIVQGPQGPLFQISDADGGVHVASSPQDAWTAAAAARDWPTKYARRTAVRAFGFDSPLIQSLLQELKPVAVEITIDDSEQAEDSAALPDASLAGNGSSTNIKGVLRLRPQVAEARTLHSGATSWASFAVLLEARENKGGARGEAGGGTSMPTPTISTRRPQFTAAMRKKAAEKSREREETREGAVVVEKEGGGSLAAAPVLSIVCVLRPKPLRATLLAAVVGPLRPLYVLLCEDNVFRLLPGDDLQGPEGGGAVRQAFERAFPGRKVEEALLPPKSAWRRVRQGRLLKQQTEIEGWGGWGRMAGWGQRRTGSLWHGRVGGGGRRPKERE